MCISMFVWSNLKPKIPPVQSLFKCSFFLYVCFAGEIALSAFEGIFPRMCPHVSFEIYSLFAGEFTLSTIERIFSWMNSNMPLEVASYCAGVVTFHAWERLFTRVSQHVFLQWFIRCARITALIALERFFSGMFTYVQFEMGRKCGRILAHFATVELFPVMQSFLGIFFCCHCLHLQGFSLMALAARFKDNWTLRNLGQLESVCCSKWELSNCPDVSVKDVNWDDQLDKST